MKFILLVRLCVVMLVCRVWCCELLLVIISCVLGCMVVMCVKVLMMSCGL